MTEIILKMNIDNKEKESVALFVKPAETWIREDLALLKKCKKITT